MKCPKHQIPMQRWNTRYGGRWQCPSEGCTVACWEGGTSTPADQETRDARHLCHQTFDPMWKNKTKFLSRKKAYLWLQDTMQLPPEKVHIGMFDLQQCRELLTHLGAIDEVSSEAIPDMRS